MYWKVRIVARLASSELEAEVTKFQASLGMIQDELTHFTSTAVGLQKVALASSASGERFVDVMKPFVAGAEGQVEELMR